MTDKQPVIIKDINDIRNLPEINVLYHGGEAKGRTWGAKGSFFEGSHINFFGKESIVIVYQGKKKNSKFFIANFIRDDCTSGRILLLKNKIIDIMRKHGIELEEKK
ncbi:MAG: hypothetical protein WCP92_02710 [bacterium]